MCEIPNAEELVDQCWPRHGPYSAEHTEAAVDALGELVRYLNYATGQGADRALPYAASVYTVVGGLRAVAGGLEQTLRQLTTRVGVLRDDPTLGHCDRRHQSGERPAGQAGAAAASESLTAAVHAVSALYDALNAAQSHLGSLYHREQGAGHE